MTTDGRADRWGKMRDFAFCKSGIGRYAAISDEKLQVHARENLPMGQGKHSIRLCAGHMSRLFPIPPLPPKGELEVLNHWMGEGMLTLQ